jgi:hypothetical protein
MEFTQVTKASNENNNSKIHLSLNANELSPHNMDLIIPETNPKPFKTQDPLNKNKTSYYAQERISENKLLRPIPRRPYQQRPPANSLKRNISIEDNVMLKPSLMGIQNRNENLLPSLINADTNHVKLLKNNRFLQSPGTTYSMGSVFNKNPANYESFRNMSSKCSPMPCLFDVNWRTNQRIENCFDNADKGITPVRTLVYKPLTNNNLNIYNFPVGSKKNFLAKRSLNTFQSSENLWNSLKLSDSTCVSKIKNTNIVQDIKYKSEEWVDNELHVRFKLSPTCLETCNHEELKSQVIKMLTEYQASNKNCLELSFDNFQRSSNNQLPLKLKDSASGETPELGFEGANSSQNVSFGIIKNIVWNSFLRNNNNVLFKNQLEDVMDKVLNKLKNNNKLIYHKVNIFTLINLQIPMNNAKFHSLSSSVKLRVICMLFAKYVNRKPIIEMCSEFITEIDLSMDHKDIKNIFIR